MKSRHQTSLESECIFLVKTPWDARAFNIDTFEILDSSEEALSSVVNAGIPGHYTLRVDPLSSKKILHRYGFYYCDTLVEPYCRIEDFVDSKHEGICLSTSLSIGELISISQDAFLYGRFHRDFNIDNSLANLRYDLWLRDLHREQNVFGLMYYRQLVGFFGFSTNKIVLHALDKGYKGKGLAKYFWSAACRELFSSGYSELASSISSANIPALNLYASLGFKFRNPKDIYHLIIN